MAGAVALGFPAALWAAPRDEIPAEITGQASVIDGDTITIHKIRIRFYGIDAPESRQLCQDGSGRDYRCGQRAALALSDKIARQIVHCTRRDIDRYGRMVAVCRAGGVDLNSWMVSRGWAIAYRRYATDYVGAEGEAESARRGLWAGSFLRPEEWRRAEAAKTSPPRRQAARQSPTEHAAAPTAATRSGPCLIKGNVSHNTGARIYHVPGGMFYEQTVISPWRGERWFCTEAEAQAAGWRRSRR